MKNLVNYIQEGLKLTSKLKINNVEYNYHPKTKKELKKIIEQLIEKRGPEADLNDIDTSAITDMSLLFYYIKFDGDISDWDVSNVENMSFMFTKSYFTGKNTNFEYWDVSNVKNMTSMFWMSKFNGDISKWNVSSVKDMGDMFKGCPLEQNPPAWYKNN